MSRSDGLTAASSKHGVSDESYEELMEDSDPWRHETAGIPLGLVSANSRENGGNFERLLQNGNDVEVDEQQEQTTSPLLPLWRPLAFSPSSVA